MKSNNIALKTAALVLLGLLTSIITACGGGGGTTTPTVGTSSLKVTLQGKVNGQVSAISGSVQISGPTSATLAVDATGVVTFAGIPDGAYTINAFSNFGYPGKSVSQMVTGSTLATVVLDAANAVELLSGSVNGQTIYAGGKPVALSGPVTTPADFSFQIHAMNAGPDMVVRAAVIGSNGDALGFQSTSVTIPLGDQITTVSIPGFRPCLVSGAGYSTVCSSQSTQVVVTASVAGRGGTGLQQIVPLPLTYN